ncbi:MAG: glycosyltransferase, partial [Acidimicrobiales bacterium]
VERCLAALETTDYPSFDVTVVDSGQATPENRHWWDARTSGLDLSVQWWERPFNWSAVNNRAVATARGDVLVFLNDDTEVLDRSWLLEMVGWAVQPGIGVVGLQLTGTDGRLQSAGTVLGLTGFAGHLFEGARPGDDTLLGPTSWYRNVLAATGACLAVRRTVFSRLDGFDERFELCGSDVAFGLAAHRAGWRNLCSPFAALRHLGSATRGPDVPEADFHTSFWPYQPWLFGGDPYFSPNLSFTEPVPALRWPGDPEPAALIEAPLRRSFPTVRQVTDPDESLAYAERLGATRATAEAVAATHAAHREPALPRTVNWFVPDLDSPFYGGINTALRLADLLAREHGVEPRFVVWGRGPEAFIRSALAAAFPALAGAEIVLHDGSIGPSLAALPAADAAIATLWGTAYLVAHFPHAARKFYLVQDFEPEFHPAGTMFALAEETYRLGLYGLCNSEPLRRLYEGYGGRAAHFVPAVDPLLFHA